MTEEEVRKLVSRISISLFGIDFTVLVERDKFFKNGRLYLQVMYDAPCTHTGEFITWKGRKFYLSEFMTPDEVIKTAYTAFKMAVEHEVMEGFKVDNIILFNPHINFEELLKVSHLEVKRQ